LGDTHGVADLAHALGVIVICGGGSLEDSGTDEEIVADFDGDKQACACSHASQRARARAGSSAAEHTCYRPAVALVHHIF
jgi:hypothetical protein